jgi:hypothetical protein
MGQLGVFLTNVYSRAPSIATPLAAAAAPPRVGRWAVIVPLRENDAKLAQKSGSFTAIVMYGHSHTFEFGRWYHAPIRRMI